MGVLLSHFLGGGWLHLLGALSALLRAQSQPPLTEIKRIYPTITVYTRPM